MLVWRCCLALLPPSHCSPHSTSCQQGCRSVLPGSGCQGPPAKARSGSAVGQAEQWKQSLAGQSPGRKATTLWCSGRSGESCVPPSFSPSIMKGAEMAAADTAVAPVSHPPAALCSALQQQSCTEAQATGDLQPLEQRPNISKTFLRVFWHFG